LSIADTHELAVVETDRIGESVVIGSYCVVGPVVTLEDGVRLHPQVVASGEVTIGAGVEVFPGVVLGKPPARSMALSRQPVGGGALRIGSGCSIGPGFAQVVREGSSYRRGHPPPRLEDP
jgi:acyl-[acyl carrier protein]--UDP-N-acetylglucosamine O-acyltransferase